MPGAGADVDFVPWAPTAKTLIARSACVDPHDGQFTFVGFVIDRCRNSNLWSHFLQQYS
jgi:hypothetical protein